MSPLLTDVVHRSKGHGAPTLFRGHGGGMAFVAFVSNDQIISASDEDKTVRQWSLSEGRGKVVREAEVCAVATSPNGHWLAMGGRNGRVRLFDLRETPMVEVTRSAGKHAEVVTSLAFSSDSSQLVSGAKDGTMIMWSWTSTALEQAVGPHKGHRDSVWRVCYSPDGRKIASSDREMIQIWHGSSWLGVAIYEQAWSLAWSLDNHILFAGCIDGSVRFYNPSTGVLHATCKGHDDVVFSIELSHSAKFVATASWDKTVRLWDAATFQQVGPSLQHDANVHSLSISPDDSHLVSGSRNPHVRVWDLRIVAPNLFKDTVLEPNRAPQTNGSRHVTFPSWLKPTKPHNHSDTSNHKGLPAPEPRNETPENSDNNSTRSKSSKKSGFLNLFNKKRERGDTIDDPGIYTPTTQESGHANSNHSLHHPVEDPPVLNVSRDHAEVASSSQHSAVNDPPSPIQLRRHSNENENASFIQEIRSNPTYDLTGCIEPEGNYPVSGGSHGDIYRGMLNVNGRTMQVAIKAVKRYTAQGDDQSNLRRLRREIKLWLKLDHTNIVPLLGTTNNYGDFPAMVCPWAENGSLTSYLDRRHKHLTTQMRLDLVNDVVLGLQYLHSQSVVHGDISGSNVLVYGSGRACIADFGLSFVEPEFYQSSIALTYQVKGTLRWTAPELLEIRQPVREEEDRCWVIPTLQSDIYSFAGIMLHALSGKVPYYYYPRDQHVILAICNGEHPRRPTTAVTDDQWDFMMACWSSVPMDRPSDSDMVAFVRRQLRISAAPTITGGESTGRRDTW